MMCENCRAARALLGRIAFWGRAIATRDLSPSAVPATVSATAFATSIAAAAIAAAQATTAHALREHLQIRNLFRFQPGRHQ